MWETAAEQCLNTQDQTKAASAAVKSELPSSGRRFLKPSGTKEHPEDARSLSEPPGAPEVGKERRFLQPRSRLPGQGGGGGGREPVTKDFLLPAHRLGFVLFVRCGAPRPLRWRIPLEAAAPAAPRHPGSWWGTGGEPERSCEDN